MVTVTYNSSHVIAQFVQTLQSAPVEGCDLIIVDSGSVDAAETAQIAEAEGVKFVASPTNLGYGGGSNLGAEAASSKWVFFVNPDVNVTFAQLETLARAAEDNGLTCVGPTVVEDDGSIRTTWGRTVTPPWRRRSRGWDERGELIVAQTISGCCMGLELERFKQLGGFDESFFMFSEEMDLHRRISLAGGVVACVKTVQVTTPGGGSSLGVTNRWRLVERAVGHTRYVRKHFSPPEAGAAVAANVMRILTASGFKPRLESLRQYRRSLRARG